MFSIFPYPSTSLMHIFDSHFLNWSIVSLQCCVNFKFIAVIHTYMCVCAKLLQLCSSLCDPRDCSLSGYKRFSRREHWSRLPCPSPGDLSDPGIEPVSLMSPALAGRFFTTSTTWEAPLYKYILFQILFHYNLLQDFEYRSLCYTV